MRFRKGDWRKDAREPAGTLLAGSSPRLSLRNEPLFGNHTAVKPLTTPVIRKPLASLAFASHGTTLRPTGPGVGAGCPREAAAGAGAAGKQADWRGDRAAAGIDGDLSGDPEDHGGVD